MFPPVSLVYRNIFVVFNTPNGTEREAEFAANSPVIRALFPEKKEWYAQDDHR